MSRAARFRLPLLLALFAQAGVASGQITLLHRFAGGANDGRNPQGNLTLSGDTLFGMTLLGGNNDDKGVLFKSKTDGSGYGVLRKFAGGANDGRNPSGSLTLSGNLLFGMASGGGANDLGVIFKIKTDGTEFGLLHSFAGGANDGRNPSGSLTLSGDMLFGMTQMGGNDNVGVLFKSKTDGTGFSVLHKFAGGANDGRFPEGSLILSGDTLFGMSLNGGNDELGTVFKIKTDGTGFSLLHKFERGQNNEANNGASPFGSLILSGDTLFGMTQFGGTNNRGTVFKIKTDGSGFGVLHRFAGGANDGRAPRGDLTLLNSTLFGMTASGGNSDGGVIFKINTDGSSFGLIHKFAGGANDGRNPQASLTLSGSTFYGMTQDGGNDDKGVVFTFTVPEPSTPALLAPALAVAAFRYRRRARRSGAGRSG